MNEPRSADDVAPPPGVIGMLESMRRSQEPKLIYVYERDWLRVRAENERLRQLLSDAIDGASTEWLITESQRLIDGLGSDE